MRKIDISDYEVTLAATDGQKKIDFYDVKESLSICLFHPTLQLDGRELLKRGKILDKIEQANGTLVLEEAEYEKLKSAFEQIQGFSKNDLEMVDRVLNAEEIEVKEKGA
jgi:hypothetical protein